MAKSKASYQQLIVFRMNAERYMEQHPEETKLRYALDKMLERTAAAAKDWTSKCADLQLDHAAVDQNGCVIFTTNPGTGAREYKYSKEGLKKLDAAVDEAFTAKNSVQVDTYAVTELPKDLHSSWKPVFSPFLVFEAVN